MEKYLLHKAVDVKLVETVRFLLEHKFDVNLPDDDGDSPLHHAVVTENEEIVKILLEAGADVTGYSERDKTTPLGRAVLSSKCSEKILELLIDAGSDVNARLDNKRTLLHKAASVRNGKLVKLLLKAGAKLEEKSGFFERTPLFAAIEFKDIEMVEMLLEYGADVTVVDNLERTPLELALDTKFLKAACELIQAGADAGTRDLNEMTTLHLVAQECASSMEYDVNLMYRLFSFPGTDINARNMLEQTPLHVAIKAKEGKNYYDTIKTLLQNGADLLAKDNEGVTPLQLLKFHSKFGPEVEDFLSKYLPESTNNIVEKKEDFKRESDENEDW